MMQEKTGVFNCISVPKWHRYTYNTISVLATIHYSYDQPTNKTCASTSSAEDMHRSLRIYTHPHPHLRELTIGSTLLYTNCILRGKWIEFHHDPYFYHHQTLQFCTNSTMIDDIIDYTGFLANHSCKYFWTYKHYNNILL